MKRSPWARTISATSRRGRVIFSAASARVGYRPQGEAAGYRGDWEPPASVCGRAAGRSECVPDGRVRAQTVWGQAFADTGKRGCLATSQPDDVGGDGGVGAFTGKQIGVGLSPAPVEAQGFQQFETEWNIAIAAALPVNADHHALTIEVTDLETAKFGPSHGGGIQSHEQGAVIEIACRIDEPGYFLRAEDYGQPSGGFGKRNVLGQKIPA